MSPFGVCPYIAICLIIVTALCWVMAVSAHVTNPDMDENEFENVYGLPGVQFDYRFEVGAGRSQCFYQRLVQDSEFHVTFEVFNAS